MGALAIMSVVGLNAAITGNFPYATTLAPQGQVISRQALLLIVVFDLILCGSTLMIFVWFVSVLRRSSHKATQ